MIHDQLGAYPFDNLYLKAMDEGTVLAVLGSYHVNSRRERYSL